MANTTKRIDVGTKAVYRKIDVDALDEDRYIEEESADAGAADNMVNSRATDVRTMLNKGQTKEAVLKALENPPVGSKNASAKDKNLQTVMDALAGVKSNDIAGIVKSLSQDTLDVLMKYIYAGMAVPTKFNNSATLLAWHEQVIEAAGLGSIVRVLTDRKTVV